jgi:hypothetical protein
MRIISCSVRWRPKGCLNLSRNFVFLNKNCSIKPLIKDDSIRHFSTPMPQLSFSQNLMIASQVFYKLQKTVLETDMTSFTVQFCELAKDPVVSINLLSNLDKYLTSECIKKLDVANFTVLIKTLSTLKVHANNTRHKSIILKLFEQFVSFTNFSNEQYFTILTSFTKSGLNASILSPELLEKFCDISVQLLDNANCEEHILLLTQFTQMVIYWSNLTPTLQSEISDNLISSQIRFNVANNRLILKELSKLQFEVNSEPRRNDFIHSMAVDVLTRNDSHSLRNHDDKKFNSDLSFVLTALKVVGFQRGQDTAKLDFIVKNSLFMAKTQGKL